MTLIPIKTYTYKGVEIEVKFNHHRERWSLYSTPCIICDDKSLLSAKMNVETVEDLAKWLKSNAIIWHDYENWDFDIKMLTYGTNT